MKKKTLTMVFRTWALIAVFLMVGMAWYVDAAVVGPTSITIKHACISMPDGVVTAATGTPAVSCPAGTIKMWLPADSTASPPATGLLAPGSFVITAAEGDNLSIVVTNELSIPVSLVIPGQVMSNNTGPVWFSDIANPYTSATAVGSRPAPANPADPEDLAYKYRVRSFSHETAGGAPGAPGAAATYTWNNLKAGTYLILSGTHPSLQVQMGIYGVLIVRTGGGAPYGGIAAPAQEVTLLFSEIDPVIHNAVDDALMVAAPPTIPSTNDFKPRYFLINGKAFPAGNPIPIGAAGTTTLLRFANAGLDTYVPLLQNQYMQVIAEDGYLKDATLRFSRYSVDLHAGKTFDALLVNPATAGYIPLYDRRLYLSNASQSPGGMMTYLEVGGPGGNLLTVATNGGTGTGVATAVTMPGGIYCDSSVPGTDCTQEYFAGTQVKLVAEANQGSQLNPSPNGWTGCDSLTLANECLVTMNGAKNVKANFTLLAGPTPSTNLTLKKPNKGKVKKSKLYKIKWKFKVDPGPTIKIDLYQNGQYVAGIADAAPAGTPNKKGKGKGIFEWTVAPGVAEGTGYQVVITSNSDLSLTDTSDKTFSIVP
jgi:FtsP/CotA-like multicopper oxidase with cupredoxin domain